MIKNPSLTDSFRPEKYELRIKSGQLAAKLAILGSKIGRPSRRITLHQKGLRVTGAKVRLLGKAGRDIEVVRINHLPTLEQIRIHTKEMIYPGNYQIEIDYELPPSGSIQAITPSRDCLPCIDEAEAWSEARLEVKQ